jgi:hypothetical protein
VVLWEADEGAIARLVDEFGSDVSLHVAWDEVLGFHYADGGQIILPRRVRRPPCRPPGAHPGAVRES